MICTLVLQGGEEESQKAEEDEKRRQEEGGGGRGGEGGGGAELMQDLETLIYGTCGAKGSDSSFHSLWRTKHPVVT